MITKAFYRHTWGSIGEKSDAEVCSSFLQDHTNPISCQDISLLKSESSTKHHDQIDHESVPQASAYRPDHL